MKRSLSETELRCSLWPRQAAVEEETEDFIRLWLDEEGVTQMTKTEWVGTGVTRIDAKDKVRGMLKYMSDLSFPNMIHGAVLRSKHPHALIKKIDTKRAQELDGVVAVLTHEDVPGLNGFGIAIPDQPVLCRNKVRYMGDAIALVGAESKETAEHALELIEVEYELLPIVDDPEQAMLESSPKVHDTGNIHNHVKIERGDVEAAFKEAQVVVENTYSTPRQMHAFLEPESGVATIDEDRNITIWCGGQHPYRDQLQVARALGMNPRKIRIINTPTGGAFGGKDEITVQIYLALLTLHTGRPAKIVLSREESVVAGMKRHPMKIHMKTAAAADGTLLANEARIVSDTGAYASLGGPVIGFAIEHSCGAYRVENVNLEGFCVYTDNGVAGAFRGFGANQVTFAVETQLDMIAEKLGIDKLEIRKKNALRSGDIAPLGHKMEASVGLLGTLEAAENSRLWQLKEEFKANPSAPFKKRGIGIACSFQGCGLGKGLPDYGAASIELLPNGQFAVGISCPEIGQGNTTAFTQMAADYVGCSIEDIVILSGDTRHTQDSGTSTASRSIYTGGNAMKLAAENLHNSISAVACEILRVPEDEITFRHGAAVSKACEDKMVSFREIAELMVKTGLSIKGEGHFIWPVSETELEGYVGIPHLLYSYITQIALVEVNTLTGETEVLEAVSVPDPGKAINPQGVEGQSEGGVVMGMGYALTEDTIIEEGITLTRNFSTYILPTSLDMPCRIETIIAEEPEPSGPFGAKGIGEAVCVPISPAITNAIHDAVKVWIRQIPATPERVYTALKKREAP
jgi:xanthine dehydrogenase D subunit